ncbi:MAG: hypothetical protein HZB09_01780 [Candidatus Yonathbacteria bacterium]|nr:hypothetical protein [Candidatus Yonathbacteria bacterium]
MKTRQKRGRHSEVSERLPWLKSHRPFIGYRVGMFLRRNERNIAQHVPPDE